MAENNIFLAIMRCIMYNSYEAKNGRPVAAFVCSGCPFNREKRFCMK